MRKLFIDGKTIQDDGNCYVIAEIGHNHQGDLETAKEMLRVAKECGADAVKLQKCDNRELYTWKCMKNPTTIRTVTVQLMASTETLSI